MGSGRGGPGWLRAGGLAAIAIPLVLLVGVPAGLAYGGGSPRSVRP